MRRTQERGVRDRVAAIADAAARAMWLARDTLSVRMLPNACSEPIQWQRHVVSFDDIEYLPVDSVSDDLQQVTSLLLCADGAVAVGSDTPTLIRTWDATLAWRMIRRMTGTPPALQASVMVPRAPDPYRPERMFARLRRTVQPHVRITDPHDIAINELCMLALARMTAVRTARTEWGPVSSIGQGVTVRQRGNRYASFHIVDPAEGAVPVPRRLHSTFRRMLDGDRATVPE